MSQINMATSSQKSDKNPRSVEVTEADKTRSKLNLSKENTYSRQLLDGLILLNFFIFFVASFVAGLLFLYSSLSIWTIQVCEDSEVYQMISFATEPQTELISVVTYNASAPLSLKT